MLWQVSSGDLKTIIESEVEELEDNTLLAIEREKPQSLGAIVQWRRLTGWPESTTIDELEGEDLIASTEVILKKAGRWQD